MREIDLKPDELLDLSNDIFAKGSHIMFKARGHSMYPSIQDGDVLDIEAVGVSYLKIGDIAFFRSSGNRPTVHRLIGRRMLDGRMTLIMRGDSADSEDAPVRAEEVLGRIIRIQRGEKTIILDHDSQWKIGLRIIIFLISRIYLLLSRSCKRIAVAFLTGLQGTKPYRLLTRRLIGNRVCYRIAGADDALGLSKLYGYSKFPELGDPVQVAARDIESLAGRGCILVAEAMGRIAGAVVITECAWNPTLARDRWLFSMLVRTRYRGAGIGRGLMLKAFEKMAEDGRKGMSLLVSEQNKAAINLYLKMGFKPSPVPYKDIERKTGYQGQDFVWLSKTIRSSKNSSIGKG